MICSTVTSCENSLSKGKRRMAERAAPVDTNELVSAALGPRRQGYIPNGLAALQQPQLQAASILKECWLVEELGNHLLDVAAIMEDLLPSRREAREETLRVVESATLHTSALVLARVCNTPSNVERNPISATIVLDAL
jgi:hypothetical protein